MLKTFYSNRTERLLERLILQIEAERQLGHSGVFSPSRVIVPDERLASWLKLEVAAHAGVMGHLKFMELPELVDAQLERAEAPGLLERRRLRAGLLELLADEALLGRPELSPVQRYLGEVIDKGREADDALERRRFQLADRLAALFVSYGLDRPGLLEAWARNGDEERWFRDTSGEATEAWQRALWRAHLGGAEAPGQTPRQVAQWWRDGGGELPGIVHMFGLGVLPPGHVELVEAMAKRCIVWIYAINPCQEFWEEMRFGRPEDEEQEGFSSATVDGGALEYQGDDAFWYDESQVPFALRAWGFAGAQRQRALLQAGADPEDLFDGHEVPATMLEQVQQDILELRRPDPSGLGGRLGGRLGDDSIQILAAPSARREVELVASEIWALLERRPELRPNQLAVLIPPERREIYQTHIGAVFPATRAIPHNMVDMPALSWSRAIEATQLLLALPFGQFRRQELLRLLTHPNLLGRFPHVDPQDWLRWCDELRILHGADRRDHADTYIEGELFHWDQGLRRLVLGAFMTGKRAGDRRAFELGESHYLPHEYGQQQLTSAARLVTMARSLLEDARFCRGSKMSMSGWADFICRMLATYLVAHEPGDELLLQRARQELAGLEDLDVSGRELPYRLAYEAAMDLLGELEVRRGQHLLDGVAVMGLEPGRPLPFEVVFVVGLGDGEFPSSEGRQPEDLRFVTDAAGERVNAPGALPEVGVREAHKFAFLEALLCARRRLVLSYVARDARTGDAREPSAVLEELLYAVALDYIEPEPDEDEQARQDRAAAALLTRHELRRFHPRYFPDLLGAPEGAAPLTPSAQPEALAEARAEALRQDLASHCQDHQAPYPGRKALQASVAPPLWERLRERLGLIEPPPLEPDPGEGPAEGPVVVRMSTFDLRAFLECPLQGSARFLLRLDDDEDQEILLRESELFEPSGWARMILLREVFWEKLGREHQEQRPLDFGPIYDGRARYFELEGLMPTGPFYRAARQRHLHLLTTWQDNLPRFGLGRSPRMQVRRLGRAAEHEQVDLAQEPLVLDVTGPQGQPVRVELAGRTESILPERPGSLIPHTSDNARYISPKYFVRGFLDHALLSASGEEADRPWSVIVNPGEEAHRYKHRYCVRHFEPLGPRQARAWLGGVIEDMISRVHAYYLPVEVAFEHHERDEPAAPIAERMRRDSWKTTSSDFGPVRDASRFAPPEEADEIIERRYGAIFDRMRGGD